MVDRKCKGLCYKFDQKYVWGHRYREKNIFHIDVSYTPEMEEVGPKQPSVEDVNEQPVLVSNMVELATSTEEAIIFLHALSGVSTPQTLKIKSYIKYQ